MNARISVMVAVLFLLSLTISAQLLPTSPVVPTTQDAKIEGRVKTRFGIDGRPVNQKENAKGLHRVVGSTKLIDGVATITLNSDASDGKQDVTFIDSLTYSGKAWTRLLSNRAKNYTIIPLTGKTFQVVSSDVSDTSTIHFEVEGE